MLIRSDSEGGEVNRVRLRSTCPLTQQLRLCAYCKNSHQFFQIGPYHVVQAGLELTVQLRTTLNSRSIQVGGMASMCLPSVENTSVTAPINQTPPVCTSERPGHPNNASCMMVSSETGKIQAWWNLPEIPALRRLRPVLETGGDTQCDSL